MWFDECERGDCDDDDGAHCAHGVHGVCDARADDTRRQTNWNSTCLRCDQKKCPRWSETSDSRSCAAGAHEGRP